MNKSPMYYSGNKHKIMEFIKEKFPANIKTFYDVFGGSGTVSMNMLIRADNVVYNEFDKYVYNLFNFYKDTDPQELHKRTLDSMEYYKLPSKNSYDYDEAELNEIRNNFKKMESDYHEGSMVTDPFAHHMIKQFSFSNSLAFNDYGFVKGGFGNRFYKKDVMLKNHYALYNKRITTINGSFEAILTRDFDKDDFVYMDPPYWNTNANYNSGWTWEMEQLLLKMCNVLTAKGIKWAFSNVFESKGKVNQHLKDWVKENNLYVFYPNINYSANGSGKSDNVEVFITNYDPVKEGNYTEQLSLF